MSSNPLANRAGLFGATIGIPVCVIDANGQVATGYLEHYNRDLDVFDVVYPRRKAEVTVTTNQSASGTFGNFGGNQVQALLWERKSACYVHDLRPGVERFILAGEDPQILIDFTNKANEGAQPLPEAPAQTGQTPAPEPAGKVTAPAHPDIPVGQVREPEPVTVIPPDKQKGPLPEDFPGLAALNAASITRFKDLFKQVTNLGGITGIDIATAAQIKAVLGL